MLAIKGLRSLEVLSRNGSTSRVLNLHRVHEQHRHEPGYVRAPFFKDHMLNRAIIIKHRLRADETYLMPRRQKVSTKIVFPFMKDDLRTGGKSIFVGQNNYKQLMAEIIGPDSPDTRHDLEVLQLLHGLPSLDPFLLREHLRRNGHQPDECYFDIAPVDMERMESFAAGEISQLINLAFNDNGSQLAVEMVGKLVDALLSRDADERLEPLRVTLGLEGSAFRDGIFSWKGFLYYKWQLAETMPKLQQVISQIDRVDLAGRSDGALRERIGEQRRQLKVAIRESARKCSSIMSLYDDAYNDLVNRHNAMAFRRFLLDSPMMFIELGQLMGVVSHICSFWQFRFPPDCDLSMDAVEYSDLLNEFETSLVPPRANAA